MVGVVLEGGEAINKPGAAAVKEDPGINGGVGVAEAFEDLGPTVDAVLVGGAQGDAQIGVLFGDGGAGALAGEEIGAGEEGFEGHGMLAAGDQGDAVALEHGFDGFDVAFGHPVTGGMLVHDEEVAVAVETGEQDDGVMGKAVIEGGEPLDGAVVIEFVNDMNVAAEGGEELASGDVPVAIAPGASLPAGEIVQDIAVSGVGEEIVVEGGGDEAGGGFGVLLERDDVEGPVPGVAAAAGGLVVE